MMEQARPEFTEQEVRGLLATVGDGVPPDPPAEVHVVPGHSNHLAEARYPDGRVLMVKRARYPGMDARLETSRAASRLLHEHTDVLAPRYLPIRDTGAEGELLVYWRLDHPTLAEVWPGLDAGMRRSALLEWGALMRRIHQVRLAGSGPLTQAGESGAHPLSFLREDLTERLLPASRDIWPAGAAVAERAAAVAEKTVDHLDSAAVLLHNDLFSKNVLCSVDPDRVRCVGIIDLEDAFAGPPESDLAKTEVLHGPLFGNHWEGAWRDALLAGYGGTPDAGAIGLFRAYHLLNMGYHAASTGLGGHAEEVARAAAHELDALGTGATHEAVVRGSSGSA